jgi:hypothetical protein
MKLNEVSHRF